MTDTKMESSFEFIKALFSNSPRYPASIDVAVKGINHGHDYGLGIEVYANHINEPENFSADRVYRIDLTNFGKSLSDIIRDTQDYRVNITFSESNAFELRLMKQNGEVLYSENLGMNQELDKKSIGYEVLSMVNKGYQTYMKAEKQKKKDITPGQLLSRTYTTKNCSLIPKAK